MLPHKSLFAVVSEDPCAFGLGLAAAAREDAIYFDDIVGLPVVLGAAEINTVLRNQETFSTRVFANGLMKGALVATEGAAHTDMRKLYNSFFAPRQIKAYEESIVLPAVRTVLDRLATRPEPDLLDHFCTEVPQRVVATLFGMSLERIAENDVLVRQILKAIVRPYDAEAVAEGERAYAAMAEELRAISARELEAPSATMLGEIAKALIAQGIGSVEACERIVFTLILGSYETTTWGMASTLAGLLRHPETLARVRDNPELIPAAIEESWRWCGSSTGTVRFVEEETTLGGQTLAAGSVIQLGWLALHFDADVYPNPERFDIDRKVKTMIFGGGAHYCVGAPLARMETRVALVELLARFPQLRADPDRKPPTFFPGARGSIMFGPDQLPVILEG